MATYQFLTASDRAEVEPHLDRARQSLRAATLLLGEGLVHDAVSRAHQATVHGERTLLATETRNPTSPRSVHRLAVAHYIANEQLDPAFAERLDWLGELRARADDQPLLELSDDDVEGAVRLAEEFVAAVDDYLERAGYAADEDGA